MTRALICWFLLADAAFKKGLLSEGLDSSGYTGGCATAAYGGYGGGYADQQPVYADQQPVDRQVFTEALPPVLTMYEVILNRAVGHFVGPDGG